MRASFGHPDYLVYIGVYTPLSGEYNILTFFGGGGLILEVAGRNCPNTAGISIELLKRFQYLRRLLSLSPAPILSLLFSEAPIKCCIEKESRSQPIFPLPSVTGVSSKYIIRARLLPNQKKKKEFHNFPAYFRYRQSSLNIISPPKFDFPQSN